MHNNISQHNKAQCKLCEYYSKCSEKEEYKQYINDVNNVENPEPEQFSVFAGCHKRRPSDYTAEQLREVLKSED